MKTDAYLSNDRVFRYWLLRVWDESLPMMANIGANPSTADENTNDQTIRKDMGFGERNGFGGLLKLNVGAFRATKPRDWLIAADPFGPENTIVHLKQYLTMFDVKKTVVAWGKCIGKFSYKGDEIASVLPNLWCLGRTADGTPRHTLMLPYTTPLEPFYLGGK